ncbi:hypothetical protein ABTM82_20035, partial [Acinetobacter baumannii]
PRFLPSTQAAAADEVVVYKPALYAMAGLRFNDAKAKLDCNQSKFFVTECGDGLQTVDWRDSAQVPLEDEKLTLQSVAGAK